MVNLNPYLSFRNTARDALEHYHSVLGGSLDIMTFGSMPDMGYDPSESELVMHGQLTTDDGLVAYRCTGKSILPVFLLSFAIPSLALSLHRE